MWSFSISCTISISKMWLIIKSLEYSFNKKKRKKKSFGVTPKPRQNSILNSCYVVPFFEIAIGIQLASHMY